MPNVCCAMRPRLPLPLGLALACSGFACAAHRVVPPAPAPLPERVADFSDVTLQLRGFSLTGRGPEDQDPAVAALRDAFVRTLVQHCAFAKVVVGEARPGDLHAPYLVADVALAVDHSAYRTFVLDVLGLSILWPLVPQWGKARVQAKMAVVGDAGPVWSSETTSTAPYSLLFYSWYRTGPVQAAYAEAYAQAFAATNRALQNAREPLMRSLHPAPPPRPVAAQLPPTPALTPSPAPPPAPASAPAAAGPPPFAGVKVAVLPTQIESSSQTAVPKLFDDYVLAAVQNTWGAEVIGQADLNAMLALERQHDLLDCEQATCLREIGAALDVHFIVAVRLAQMQNEWIVTAKLIDLEHSRVAARLNEIVPGQVKELLAHVNTLMQALAAARREP